MKKICKHSLLAFMIIFIFSLSALVCSAADVKATFLDTVGTTFAKETAYELVVTGEAVNVRKGKNIVLTAQVKGLEEQPVIKWISSDAAIATVNELGIVHGIAVGRALITATAEVEGKTITGYYNVNVVTAKGPIRELFSQYNVFSYRYNYVDDVYYTDDKECWQKHFGFARIYDILSPYIGMEYDYTRVFFTYEDKDFMVQLWKGQYSPVFYGSEIGIYSKPASDKEVGMFTFFNVADEEDWPMMELTLYHQKIDGTWNREFTRDYDRYWWCTGFKAGHLRITEPADELRVASRITFKSEEMAKLFADGLVDCGFAKASSKDKIGLDSFYAEGSDVYVKWQNISEAENTVPLKMGIITLVVLNVFAIIVAALLLLGFGGIVMLIFLAL